MSETTTTGKAEETEEAEEGRTLYRVTWTLKGTDKPRTQDCILDDADRTRPSDLTQRDFLLRKMIALRSTVSMNPDDVVLMDVVPLCNCGPRPGRDCVYAEHRGQRFFLTTSVSRPGFENVHDRHGQALLGTVSNTLSVELLTLVQNKYDHQ
ncbi:hypothetical protein [Streptomyces sp. NPDC001089]